MTGARAALDPGRWLGERGAPGAARGAADVLVAAGRLEAAGREIIHLEVGEPDAPTPAHIVEAGVRAMRDGHTRYAPPAGLPLLRAAVADAVAARGVAAGAEQVVVTPGAKAMLFAALLAVVRPGAEVLVPDPGYPAYAAIVRVAGGRAVPYPLAERDGFAVDPAAVAARVTPRTRVLVLNAPENPTGGVAGPAALAELVELAQRHDLLVVADEIYSRLVYPADPSAGAPNDAAAAAAADAAAVHPSVAAVPGMGERTVVVDGFSKAYAMTGWRLGYGVLPRWLVPAVTKLVAESVSCTAAFVQHAGVAALTGPQDAVRAQVAEYARRGRWLAAALDAIDGVRCAAPRGAFYAFPNVAALLARGGVTADGLARTLLEGYGVACVPGTAFGEGGAAHLRLSYAARADDLARAVERLRWCAAALGSGAGGAGGAGAGDPVS
jgi:aspartate/methionine/tyrosine aminotransferase